LQNSFSSILQRYDPPYWPLLIACPEIISGFKFTLKRKQDGKIPDYWLQNTVVSQVVASLRAWKVTDKNIALYLEDVGTKAATKLVYDWQLKENTDDRINDRVKYCNAVFVRMGKSAQERLKQEVQSVLG
jgi:hypothetical protein